MHIWVALWKIMVLELIGSRMEYGIAYGTYAIWAITIYTQHTYNNYIEFITGHAGRISIAIASS